jgi:general secretion pathway protein K
MRASLRAQRGIALLTAVMIVAIAAAVAAKIAFAHQIWFRQMENVADRGATDLLRRGALHWASAALLEDAAQNPTDHLGEAWAQGLPTLPVDGGAIKVSIEDAQGRFNLNNLVQNNVKSQPDLDVFWRLLQNLKLDPNIANALVDWIDPDSNATSPGGAEDVDYLNLKTPYRAANQPLASVDELRLVHGFDAKTVLTLLPFVTVLPAAAGHTPINVNTASPELLAAVADKDLAWAQRVADNRRDTPMQNPGEFTKQLQLPPGAAQFPANLVSVKTDFFLITLDTSIGRHQRSTVALMQRQANRTTDWIWHKPQPLLDATVLQASDGSDESAESQ